MGIGREQTLQTLRGGKTFDLLVIGGGATGCGIALDAASRGLRVALVEKQDFAEGTSSRSTKLVHGGVRYLEAAILHVDPVQYHLVRDALRERGILLRNAPHLARRLPLVTPLYRWLEIPYIWIGLKLYDLLAGGLGIGHSRLLGRRQALRRFPLLRRAGLRAGVLYYDGQFNDARMALTLALSARERGAVILNRLAAMGLLKEQGRLVGAELEDQLDGGRFALRARGVINAAGPFVDRVRRLDDPAAMAILQPSSGVHIVLDQRFALPNVGLLIPKTEDGRVLFVLPWEGHALIGTTDEPAEVREHPRPLEEEIAYLLRHVGRYFNLQVTPGDVKSAWCGLRPLVRDPKASDTARLARDHVIEVSSSGLLTIAGGKWTTYRKMAQDAVDHAVRVFGLNPLRDCRTEQLPLVGAGGNWQEIETELREEFGLSADLSGHLYHAYGDRASAVARLAAGGLTARLDENHPFIEAEVVYAARFEMAVHAVDVLARRLPLALLDRDAARGAASRVLELLAGELGWDAERHSQEAALVEQRLREGL
ncbi:glycerol-3-phosphate dehydrogenase [Geothermobacter hydrogeniphilus]|uniref:Glycerol-3-phosphate dehydrogenase n=1 Tax=Geothermobacter hydrogeniphilus TaxID=1969733 RepID=A0A2K2HBF6_9BACT|nr:FAD-dependent oxidoreductase [Geothermobacter hydrogeniphilus]PNU20563.1 glycerol-3-phosphate dehydrogenase [Geothermobacter hydrogeniphilus]